MIHILLPTLTQKHQMGDATVWHNRLNCKQLSSGCLPPAEHKLHLVNISVQFMVPRYLYFIDLYKVKILNRKNINVQQSPENHFDSKILKCK